MHKTIRRGFTLVEMMVVMTIIAILAVVGIAALTNINSGNVVDRATEEIVTTIRESQNKAISVANNPGAGAIPSAWGVQIDPITKRIESFVLVDQTPTQTNNKTVLKTVYSSVDPSITSVLENVTIDTGGDNTFFYVTPFGKFYTTSNFSSLTWSSNAQRPYDLLPSNRVANKTEVTITYRNNTKTVVVEKNGDVQVKGNGGGSTPTPAPDPISIDITTVLKSRSASFKVSGGTPLFSYTTTGTPSSGTGLAEGTIVNVVSPIVRTEYLADTTNYYCKLQVSVTDSAGVSASQAVQEYLCVQTSFGF